MWFGLLLVQNVLHQLDAGNREALSAWPELIIACDVRGRVLLQTDRQKDKTDITTGLHIASFAFTGADAKKTCYSNKLEQI